MMLIGGVIALAAIIAVAAIVATVVLGGGSADATLRDAGCTIEKKPAQGRQHVAKLSNGFKYNTFPPTTGPHNAVPAIYDFYAEPVEQVRLVHNLEHGSIVVQYGSDVPKETVDQIRDWYLRNPDGIVVAPLPALKDKLVLEAWTAPDATPGQRPAPGEGVLARCPRFDEEAFDTFTDTYGFRGPERALRSDLRPGT